MPYTTSTDYKGMTLLQMYELMLWHLGQVVDAAVSYVRYPKPVLQFAVNRAQQWVNKKVPSIIKYAIINTYQNYGWYKCPPNMIPGGIRRAYYVQSEQNIIQLKLVDKETLDKIYNQWNLSISNQSSNYPEYIIPAAQMYGNRLTIEVFPRPPISGTWAAPSAAFGTGEAPGVVGTLSGLVSLGGSSTQFSASGVNFSQEGVKTGMFVWNITDSAYGRITAISGSQITHTALTGGASWASNERYEIVRDYVGIVCDWNNDDDDIYIYSAELPSISSIGAVPGNIILEYLAMPTDLTSETSYPQVPKHLQDALLYKALAITCSVGHEKVRMAELSEKYHVLAEQEIAPYVSERLAWPFSQKHEMFVVPKLGRT